jgi:hypothetical protein
MSRPAGQWIRVEVYFGGEEKEWSNIYWFQVPTGTIDASLDFKAATDDIFSQFSAAYLPVLSSLNWILGCAVTFNGVGGAYTVDKYQRTNGTGAATEVPEDLAFVVQRLSFTSGANGRGRIYISGFPQAFLNGSYLSASGILAANAFASALDTINVASTLTLAPAVFSNSLSSLFPVSEFNAILLLGTQRHRRTRF